MPEGEALEDDTPDALQLYATRLHQNLLDIWRAAAQATRDDQEVTASDLSRVRQTGISFKVGDRVCRKLHDRVNNLQWQWAGPYRVHADQKMETTSCVI